MKKRVLLLALMLLLVVGCRRVPQLADGGEAMVSFSNEEFTISADDLFRELVDRFGIETLIGMIDRQLLEYEFADSLESARDYADDQLEAIRTIFVGEDGRPDENRLLQIIHQVHGFESIELFLQSLEMEYLRNLAADEFARSRIIDEFSREIEDFYENDFDGDVRASHILIGVDVPANATAAERSEAEDAARAEARELIRRLNAGEDFAELAREYSDCASANEGGDLGFFNQAGFSDNVMVPAFQSAAFALEMDRYSREPVQTDFGFHIILKTDQREKPSFDSVRDQIIDVLAGRLRDEEPAIEINALRELRRTHGVRIEDTSLNSQYEAFINALIRRAEDN